ncbi:DUF397 domain-containing protein [Saccharothrix violaceirubra]|uniref:DUF397 domain-containing protein n=1 Tax=Saccharothrix violaceirubra TaxID=413306 RepID=A0A7W7WUA6_9PSEU|nr:DUF397 domain-containing protein [Saccharothrix violaceirubra]MBB4963542.1 hypothetical protein [Saccharothrix violaceirubra]
MSTFTAWRKSSYSGPPDNDCVEVGFGGDGVGLRDSKAPDEGVLVLSRRGWAGFLSTIKSGDAQVGR